MPLCWSIAMSAIRCRSILSLAFLPTEWMSVLAKCTQQHLSPPPAGTWAPLSLLLRGSWSEKLMTPLWSCLESAHTYYVPKEMELPGKCLIWHYWNVTRSYVSLGCRLLSWEDLVANKSINFLLVCDEVLAWLSVWSEMHMICIWSSWCHCQSVISCFIEIQIGLTFLVLAYPGCPGKQAVKWVSVCLSVCLCLLSDRRASVKELMPFSVVVQWWMKKGRGQCVVFCGWGQYFLFSSALRLGLVVAHWSESTKLLYAGPC